MIVFVHGHHRHIAVKIAVDSQANIRSNETASYNRKFAVYILGSAISPGHALLGDDDGANQSSVGVVTFEIVGVIEPDDRTGVVGPWAGALRHFPDVGVGRARGDDSVMCGIVGAIVVIRTSCRLSVDHSLG